MVWSEAQLLVWGGGDQSNAHPQYDATALDALPSTRWVGACAGFSPPSACSVGAMMPNDRRSGQFFQHSAGVNSSGASSSSCLVARGVQRRLAALPASTRRAYVIVSSWNALEEPLGALISARTPPPAAIHSAVHSTVTHHRRGREAIVFLPLGAVGVVLPIPPLRCSLRRTRSASWSPPPSGISASAIAPRRARCPTRRASSSRTSRRARSTSRRARRAAARRRRAAAPSATRASRSRATRTASAAARTAAPRSRRSPRTRPRPRWCAV